MAPEKRKFVAADAWEGNIAEARRTVAIQKIARDALPARRLDVSPFIVTRDAYSVVSS
jgi:hypothetical protein